MADEAPKTEEVTVEPSPPKIEFVNADKRSITVDLDWPILVDGEEISQVSIKRASAKDVQHFIERSIIGGEPMVPPFIDCSIDVWDAMDDDDQQKLDKASMPFIPRRLQTLRDRIDGQASNDGGNTSD